MQQKTYISFIVILFAFSLNAQKSIHQTFKDTRVINTPSVETLRGGILDFRIGHRFGDAAGIGGGWPTFYGLENATDVSFGFDFGLSDNMMIGIARNKGAGPLKSNVNFGMKYRVMRQEIGGKNPFSLAFSGMASYSTMQRSEFPFDINFFEKGAHRLSYNLQVLIASRLSERMAIQVGAGWTYRNIVRPDDFNDLPSLSFVFKYQFSKVFGLILDSNFTISDYHSSENGFYPAIGVGFEWETGGGHVFQINLTNATGMAETDYIPYTTSSWGDGGYRLGFTISRQFKL